VARGEVLEELGEVLMVDAWLLDALVLIARHQSQWYRFRSC